MKKTILSKLQELKHAKDCLRSPSLRSDYVPLTKYTDKTANGLTKCVIDWINLNGGQAERINTMGRFMDNSKQVKDVMGITRTIGTKKYIPTTGTKGSADISSVIQGRAVKIEIKMKDKQSIYQVEYQRHIEEAGGQYWLVHDFEEFVFHYESFENYLKNLAQLKT